MKIDLDDYMRINLTKFYLIDKNSLAKYLFYIGVLLAFYASMSPWFLWRLSSSYVLVSSILIFLSIAIYRSGGKTRFTNGQFIRPTPAFLILAYYQVIVNGINLNGYIARLFFAFIFFSIFRYGKEFIPKLATILAKSLALILSVSIPFFLLYLIGFPLPSQDLTFGDNFYSFTNYFFFLIDDRQLFAIVPRFQSVFLEPGYLGSATALLLQTQRGKWKKWYCIVLICGLLLSFSLAGYVYLVVVSFLNLWSSGKRIFMKAIFAVCLFAGVIGLSFVYNGGDNLIHNLILLRLEITDGEMVGNNRVSESFETEYNNFLGSSDILFGRYKSNDFGDSGYKVFFYDYGLVGVVLLFIFYGTFLQGARNKRAMISAAVLALLIFIVDGFMLWYWRVIPLYCTAHSDDLPQRAEEDPVNSK